MSDLAKPIYTWRPAENGKNSLLGPLWLTWLTIIAAFGIGLYILLDGFADYEPYNRLGGALLIGGSLLLLVIHLLGYHPDNHVVLESDGSLRWRLSRAEATQSFNLDTAVAMRHRPYFSRTTITLENGRQYVLPTRNIYDGAKRKEFVDLLDERVNQPAVTSPTA